MVLQHERGNKVSLNRREKNPRRTLSTPGRGTRGTLAFVPCWEHAGNARLLGTGPCWVPGLAAPGRAGRSLYRQSCQAAGGQGLIAGAKNSHTLSNTIDFFFSAFLQHL